MVSIRSNFSRCRCKRTGNEWMKIEIICRGRITLSRKHHFIGHFWHSGGKDACHPRSLPASIIAAMERGPLLSLHTSHRLLFQLPLQPPGLIMKHVLPTEYRTLCQHCMDEPLGDSIQVRSIQQQVHPRHRDWT